ncbi:MAG: SDR family NAD(P)-dependent oxidoreductase [Anaerolineae bacterium]|nr:SDR family NAD(P)-dependent oxidoreductase [Anaerolineae bacterium]
MKSLWNDADAAQHAGQGDLALRVYTSRLLGSDHSLIMCGGGNTSIKRQEKDIFGEDETILYVKGSGWDLETIEPQGFSPARMSRLLRLSKLDAMSDPQMVAELRGSLTNPHAPTPSVEAILHALLPYKWVDHTHSDAVLAIINTPDGEKRIQDVYGDRVVYIPYVMPGFKLARYVADAFPAQATPQTQGMVLYRHGIFTFGETAKIAYERMIEFVSMAEEYLKRHNAWQIALPRTTPAPGPFGLELARLRKEASDAAGFPMILMHHNDPEALGFARHPELERIARQGPVTPDHVIRTKRVPLIGRDVQGYKREYEDYFRALAPEFGDDLIMVDPAPRVILDPELGMLTLGQTVRDALTAEDVYRHTIKMILQSEALSRYETLPAREIFEIEYWDLEQAKLRRAGTPPVYAGDIAIVTGAAAGVGKAAAAALLKRGMAVVGLDTDPAVKTAFPRGEYLGLVCDVSDPAQVAEALEHTARRFGGLDVIALTPVHDAHAEFDGLVNAALPFLKLSPRGARLVALSAGDGVVDMAAWANAGVRANAVHVRDTSPDGLAAAAEMAAEMCGPLFARTTLAQVPVNLSAEVVR